MATEIKVPSVGESVREGMIHRWLKNDGELVQIDDVLVELETDKATVEIVAENSGILSIKRQAGDKVAVGEVIAVVSESSAIPASPPQQKQASLPAKKQQDQSKHLSPAVRRLVNEQNINPEEVQGTGKDARLLKQDVVANTQTAGSPSKQPHKDKVTEASSVSAQASTRREPMSMVRRRIASRLVAAQNETAMLTTFNEINMEQVIAYRRAYKDAFSKKYGISLGFMGFFAAACSDALQEYPQLNAFVIDDEIEYHDHVNLGVAVSTERGLLVPVIKGAEHLSLVEIELQISAFAQKAREGKITIADMEGGTFTVSNGGVFGSLLSTPILNPPQSGILGMHKIEKRPVVVDDEIKIASMMYVALSYDHRIADGKEAVGCLKRVKELVETPARLVMKI